MQKPTKFLMRMSVFLVAAIALMISLRGPLEAAFLANVPLNGLIAAMLVIGAIYAFRRVLALNAEIEWISAFQAQETTGITTEPRLMAPAAALLRDDDNGAMRLSALSMRSVLDGIATRLEETREVSRYLTGLLIFLGLLGTFWGLLGTIGAIGGTIQSLSVNGGDMTLMFDELKAGLQAPLSGMGTAFSSSLFGLAGSLVLGFMDLQASQAQTRFYNGVEDWLASVTKLSRGGDIEGGMANPSAYMTALMEQTADGIERLQRVMKQSEEARTQGQQSTMAIAESLARLSDQMSQAQKSDAETSSALSVAITSLAASHSERQNEQAPAPALPPVIDDATRQHIRNLDVGIKQLIETQARSSEVLADELRSELKLVARTIAAVMDGGTLPKTKQLASADKKPILTSSAPLKNESDTHDDLGAIGAVTPSRDD